MSRSIKEIITHEFPDFDCLYSIFLLRKFGKEKYENIGSAALRFVPAGNIFEGKSPQEFLQEGSITIDIEGGYYDHHLAELRGEEKHSTAMLVAKDLGVHNDPCLGKVLNFIEKNDLHGIGIQSREPVDHLLAVPNIIRGLNVRYGPDYQHVYTAIEEVFEAAYTNEQEWFQALADIDKGKALTLYNTFKILAFTSPSTFSAKAGRYRQADLCVILGKAGTLNLTTSKSRKWPDPDLTKAAKIIRFAEALRTHEPVDQEKLGAVGSEYGWFLHESLAFLSRGSFKKTDVPVSSLSLDELFKLAVYCFDPKENHLGVFHDRHKEFLQVLGAPMSGQLMLGR